MPRSLARFAAGLIVVSAVSLCLPAVRSLAGTDPADACAASKQLAAAKKLTAKVKCYANAGKKKKPVDGKCLAKAEAKFDGDFAKAEDKGGCTKTGDAAGVELLVDGWLADLLAALPSAVDPAHFADLTISEIANTGAIPDAEFVEIHNAGTATLALDSVYLTDTPSYWGIVDDSNDKGNSTDFLVQFPAASTIPPGGYQTVSVGPIGSHASIYGTCPDYVVRPMSESEIAACPTTKAMRSTTQGTFVHSFVALTNTAELLVLFTWNGTSDLVGDIDYVVYGGAPTGGVVDKTGVTKDSSTDGDAATSAYAAETPAASQSVAPNHVAGGSIQRCDFTQATEHAGGNGVGGTDATSEAWATAFAASPAPATGTSATPGSAAPPGVCP